MKDPEAIITLAGGKRVHRHTSPSSYEKDIYKVIEETDPDAVRIQFKDENGDIRYAFVRAVLIQVSDTRKTGSRLLVSLEGKGDEPTFSTSSFYAYPAIPKFGELVREYVKKKEWSHLRVIRDDNNAMDMDLSLPLDEILEKDD